MSHIVVLCANRAFVKEQLVQVYMLPDNGERKLRLSHEAIIRCRDSVSWSLLLDSVIDPITGSSNLRLLRVYRYRSKRQFECVDLTLPANSTQDVLPMSVDTHVVFAMSNIRCDWGDKFLHASANGLLRGLCIVGPVPEGVRIVSPAPEGAQIRKFVIDATDERCVGVVGCPAPIWPDADVPRWRVWNDLKFDGSRGRIFYTKQVAKRLMKAVVVDLE